MNLNKKNKASLLVSVIVIFTFMTTVVLIIFSYSSNTIKHAKIQEQSLHAYYLAYSGCEIAYDALLKEAEALPLSSGESSDKWKKLADMFDTPSQSFKDKHTVCISYEGKKTEPGYPTNTEFRLTSSGTSGKNLGSLLLPLKDAVILIKVTKVSVSSPPPEENDYKGFIRIESKVKKAEETAFAATATKYLYIDPIINTKLYWR